MRQGTWGETGTWGQIGAWDETGEVGCDRGPGARQGTWDETGTWGKVLRCTHLLQHVCASDSIISGTAEQA